MNMIIKLQCNVINLLTLNLKICNVHTQLLGLLGNLKGITSELVASQCVRKLYESGEIQVVNKSDPQQLSQFSAHFVGEADQIQACNFAAFVPFQENTALQVMFSRNIYCQQNDHNNVTVMYFD